MTSRQTHRPSGREPRDQPRQRRMAALDRRKPDGRAIAREHCRGHDRRRFFPRRIRPRSQRGRAAAPTSRARNYCSTGSRSATGCWRSIARSTACIPESAEIERRHKLSRDEFLREYYSTNRPVIITGMMDDWPAMRKWNLDYFGRRFGDREVEVQMGRTAGANYETETEKYIRKIRFGDFVEKVRTAGQTNDFYLTANNNSANRTDPARAVGRHRADPGVSDRRPAGRLLLDGPGRHDHAVPPRPDQQFHGPGDRPQASQARTVVGYAA